MLAVVAVMAAVEVLAVLVLGRLTMEVKRLVVAMVETGVRVAMVVMVEEVVVGSPWVLDGQEAARPSQRLPSEVVLLAKVAGEQVMTTRVVMELK